MMHDTLGPAAIGEEAGALYRSGGFFCAEAIVYTIRRHLAPDMPEAAVAMASAFPVGVGGAGCLCGAVSGGLLCLGHCFGRTAPGGGEVQRAMALGRELHEQFTAAHGTTCCRALTAGLPHGSARHLDQCVALTAEVARHTAELILRERDG